MLTVSVEIFPPKYHAVDITFVHVHICSHWPHSLNILNFIMACEAHDYVLLLKLCTLLPPHTHKNMIILSCTALTEVSFYLRYNFSMLFPACFFHPHISFGQFCILCECSHAKLMSAVTPKALLSSESEFSSPMASCELEQSAVHLQVLLHGKLECNIFELEFRISSVSIPNYIPCPQYMPQVLLYFTSRVPSPFLSFLPKSVTWGFSGYFFLLPHQVLLTLLSKCLFV